MTTYQNGLPSDMHTETWHKLQELQNRIQRLDDMFIATLTDEQKVIIDQKAQCEAMVKMVRSVLTAIRKYESAEDKYWNGDQM